jgi:DNA-binding NarL/FixJ family response regulator
MPTSVLLIDDHELIRQGLSRAFERSEDFTVIGRPATSADGERMVAEAAPHVVVIDVRLPDGSGSRRGQTAARRNADLGIVVLTMYAGDEQLFAALEAGRRRSCQERAQRRRRRRRPSCRRSPPGRSPQPTWPTPCAAA